MHKKTLLDTMLYLVVFLVFQFVSIAIGVFCIGIGSNMPMKTDPSSMASMNVWCTLASSVLTIAFFGWRRWSPFNNNYISTRPWFTMFWVACMAMGVIIPLQFASEQIGLEMSKEYTLLFKGMMGHDLGFITIGIIAPVAEEMVFRGAILRRLNDALGHRLRWVAIGVSALLFGAVHGNAAQGSTAFVVGLLLGWMYVRTGSIVPGVVYHWVNNSTAVLLYRINPQTADMTITDYYGGNTTYIAIAIVSSLLIFGAALYQLRMRLHKNTQK